MKYKITWDLKVKKGMQIPFSSDYLDSSIALLVGEQLERTGNVLNVIFTDEMDQTWTWKEVRKLNKQLELEPQDITVFFDGGFHKEGWKAGLGVVIYFKKGNQAYRFRANEAISEMETNNEAEYAALFFALNCLEDLGVHHMPITFKGDSQVVLKQLEGEWPCFEENLNRWLDRIEGKMEKMGIKPTYVYLQRNENKEADRLATQALEGNIVRSTLEI